MAATTTYKVVKGDTLFGIAKKFGMSVDELKSLNGLASNNLSVGQTLKVKSSGATPPPAPSPAGTSTQSYRVVAGDTLFGIAKKFGMSVDALKSLNGLVSNNLSIGQVLKVKGQGSGTTTPPDPPPVTPPPVSTGSNYLSARQQFALETRPDVDCTRYFLTVPLSGGGQIVAAMRDNIPSRFAVYPQGIGYGGQSHLALDLATIESVGLTEKQARALQYVSTHEGGFDAINSYDKAIFSYGFIQFTGAAAVGGSLNRLLAGMEANAPAAFQNIFKRVGIDSEGVGKNATVTVLDDKGLKLRGDDAWLYIQRNVRLYGAFIQAGFEPSLIREQLRMANELYVQPALGFKLNVTVGGVRVSIPRLNDLLRSEASLTIVIALAINQGTGGMSKIVADAVSQTAAQQRLNTASALKQLNERLVFETVAAGTADERVRNRVNGVLFDSGLSFGSV